MLEFSPATNQLRVKTFSPTLNSLETDGDSQFTLSYAMGAPFELIGTQHRRGLGLDVEPAVAGSRRHHRVRVVCHRERRRRHHGRSALALHHREQHQRGGRGLPARLAFEPNRPNPFVSGTMFAYALPAAGNVRLSIYDVRGRRVATPLDGPQSAGRHTLRWEGRDAAGATLPPGAYFARIEFAGRSEVRKIVLMR